MRIFRSTASLLTLLASIRSAVEASPIAPYIDTYQEASGDLLNILANTHSSNAYTYPTDLTRNIVPKPIHSHNDYWRDIPFYTALAAGAISIEADVWLVNGTLYIGHEPSALTADRTFESLYINPIMDVLNRENPKTPFVPGTTRNGVFDTSSGQTLYLWVDVKTDGNTTWPYVVDALAPLRSASYLTNYSSTSPLPNGVTPGPVTVIGTGNTPLNQIAPLTSRDYFYDAPLISLNTSTYSNLTASISPIASTDFTATIGYPANGSQGFNDTQLAKMKSQIATAKAMGIGTRYWDTPAWLVGVRNLIWTTLTDLGVTLLNADNLAEAAGFSQGAGYWS